MAEEHDQAPLLALRDGLKGALYAFKRPEVLRWLALLGFSLAPIFPTLVFTSADRFGDDRPLSGR